MECIPSPQKFKLAQTRTLHCHAICPRGCFNGGNFAGTRAAIVAAAVGENGNELVKAPGAQEFSPHIPATPAAVGEKGSAGGTRPPDTTLPSLTRAKASCCRCACNAWVGVKQNV